jgi:hypothetical protein
MTRENMNEPTADPQNPPQTAAASGVRAVAELLVTIAAPLPFILLVCGSLNIDQHECNKFSLILEFFLVLAWLLWRYNARAREFFKGRIVFYVLWGLTLMVAVFSIWIFANKEHTQSASWDNWKDQLASDAKTCKTDTKCLANVLAKSVASKPRSVDQRPGYLLLDDVQAGRFVQDNAEFAPLLKQFSIGPSFLGTGLSEPVSEKQYSSARVAEFLVPNYRETNAQVWAWRLKADQLDWPLKKVLEDSLPLQAQKDFPAGPRDWKGYYEGSVKKNVALDDPTPAVVRFAELTNDEYSHCLGRKGRPSVFASHLGIALGMGMTVRDAARYSGYILTPGAGKSPYVFVFLPSSAEEVVPPTWGELLPKMADLLAKQQDLCME